MLSAGALAHAAAVIVLIPELYSSDMFVTPPIGGELPAPIQPPAEVAFVLGAPSCLTELSVAGFTEKVEPS